MTEQELQLEQEELRKKHEQLTRRLLAETPRQIPEQLFIEKYFPLLFAEDRSLFVTEWATHVAQSMQMAVNVLDEMGNVLFTVPPAIDSSADSDKLNQVLAKTAELENVTPRLGQAFFENNLENAVSLKNTKNPIYEKMWEEILNRYGWKTKNQEDREKKIIADLDVLDEW